MKDTMNGHKTTTILMQHAQTCMNLFLTHIKLVKRLQDGHTLLHKSLNTFKIGKKSFEWSQNDKNLHTATIKVLKLASYTLIAGEILTGWTQTAEKII